MSDTASKKQKTAKEIIESMSDYKRQRAYYLIGCVLDEGHLPGSASLDIFSGLERNAVQQMIDLAEKEYIRLVERVNKLRI